MSKKEQSETNAQANLVEVKPTNAFHEIRLEKKVNQAEFSKLLQSTQGTVSKIENNISRPSMAMMKILRREYAIDLNEFVTNYERVYEDEE